MFLLTLPQEQAVPLRERCVKPSSHLIFLCQTFLCSLFLTIASAIGMVSSMGRIVNQENSRVAEKRDGTEFRVGDIDDMCGYETEICTVLLSLFANSAMKEYEPV
jgi:hypothetical protein